MSDQMKRIIFLALISRCLILIIQSVSNFIIPDHRSKDAFTSIEDTSDYNCANQIIKILLSSLKRWDAEHFIHIAKYGYTYENNIAFFPIFPLCIAVFKRFFLFPFSILLTEDSLLLLAATFLNVVFFILSAIALFKLSLLVLANKILAYYATILFCINPASIFFTAPYSESMYTFCTFIGLILLEADRSILLVSLVFAVSGGVRANGIVNAGFIVYKIVRKIFESKKDNFFYLVFTGLISTAITVCPFIFYQVYIYYIYCKHVGVSLSNEIQLKAQRENYVLRGVNVSWCDMSLPVSYSYVQQKYWNIGFLHYYEFKQIPNFIIAAPILFFSLYNSSKFILNHKISIRNLHAVKSFSSYSLRLFPYVIHITFLTFFCLFYAHIQIATRMLASASPIIYWYAASMLVNNSKVLQRKMEKENFNILFRNLKSILFMKELDPINVKAVAVKFYCYFYFIVGTVFFCNGYPWT